MVTKPSIAQSNDLYFNFFVYPEIKAKALASASSAPTSSIKSWATSLNKLNASEETDLRDVEISLEDAFKIS